MGIVPLWLVIKLINRYSDNVVEFLICNNEDDRIMVSKFYSISAVKNWINIH